MKLIPNEEQIIETTAKCIPKEEKVYAIAWNFPTKPQRFKHSGIDN